jgi:PIN domain nuclease of toxin-antitoxin system
MRLLLDTCALLWFLTNDPKLSTQAKTAIEGPGNQRWLSPISLMEIALKVRIRKLPLPASFAVMFPALLNLNRIELFPIDSHHIEPLTTLPFHHKDPFDRLIIAQTMDENVSLVSVDSNLDAYGVTRLW